jgi:hypothetical protein
MTIIGDPLSPATTRFVLNEALRRAIDVRSVATAARATSLIGQKITSAVPPT